MAVHWYAIVLGLGLVVSFGYWCTDFLVIQRALAAEDLAASQRTPLIAAFPKILYGILAIFPGLIVLTFLPKLGTTASPANSYNLAIPYAMAHYFPTGLLGVGLTALLAAFMSGMAGNVTAFNTVCTYDIYRSYVREDESDRHYLNVGRIITIAGILLSIATAYIVLQFASIMDYVQLLHSIFLAPLFGTFLLGMFWRGATPWGGFAGLFCGTLGGLVLYGLELLGVISYGSPMAGNFWRAIWGWLICVGVTVVVSLLTEAKRDDELRGLVWTLTEKVEAKEQPWYKNHWVLAALALVLAVLLNVIFF
jgi:SSS family solute:Na+ symporter